MEKVEESCMKMISMSGSAKTKYILAIDAAHSGQFELAKSLQEQGKKELQVGYEEHIHMLKKSSLEDGHSVSLLLAHVEDQLANAELFEIVCRQMIRLYQKIDTLEQ